MPGRGLPFDLRIGPDTGSHQTISEIGKLKGAFYGALKFEALGGHKARHSQVSP
jgi:hypothetical protein